MNCELCGREIKGKPILIEVEGAILRVCPECARFGKVVQEARRASPSAHVNLAPRRERAPAQPVIDVENYELVEGYGQIIKRARESMGLTQDQLGLKTGIKPSLIAKIEQEKFYPDIATARRIEHALRVKIIKEAEG